MLKLSDLVKFYSSKLSELGGEQPDRINATRLKTRVLTAFADLTAHTQGRGVLLILSQEIGDVLLKAKNRDSGILLGKSSNDCKEGNSAGEKLSQWNICNRIPDRCGFSLA